MKYFLDSAKLDEIKLAYNTFGIDGVTTNPRHIMLSGKPFLTAITDIATGSKKRVWKATINSRSLWRSTPIWMTPRR